jgi:ferredoxin
MLYIDAEECIDCGACVPECPVEAIYPDTIVPDEELEWLKINAERALKFPVVSTKEEPLRSAKERAASFGFK